MTEGGRFMVQGATLPRSDRSTEPAATGLRVLFATAEVFPFAEVGSLTPAYGAGMHDLLRSRRGHAHGILDGVDYAESSPGVDPAIEQRPRSAPSNLQRDAARLFEGVHAVVRRMPRHRATPRLMTTSAYARDLAGWPQFAGAVSAGSRAPS